MVDYRSIKYFYSEQMECLAPAVKGGNIRLNRTFSSDITQEYDHACPHLSVPGSGNYERRRA